jgi:hypothetical protein
MIESATNWNALQSLVQDGRAGNAVDSELFASCDPMFSLIPELLKTA